MGRNTSSSSTRQGISHRPLQKVQRRNSHVQTFTHTRIKYTYRSCLLHIKIIYSRLLIESFFSCLLYILASQRTMRHGRHLSIYVSPRIRFCFRIASTQRYCKCTKNIQNIFFFYHFFTFFSIFNL